MGCRAWLAASFARRAALTAHSARGVRSDKCASRARVRRRLDSRPCMDAATSSRNVDDANSAVPFAVGMGLLLIMPLLIATAGMWCLYGRRRSNSTELLSTAEDHEESILQSCELLDQDSCMGSRPCASRTKTTPVHFRKADWRGCACRPLTVRVSLDGANSLPELHAVLRRAYRQASKQGQPTAMTTSLTPKERKQNLAFAVEYRDARAKTVKVTTSTDLKDLSAVKSLCVTVNASKSTEAEMSPATLAVAGAACAAADEEAPTCDQEESDTASAVSMAMVDLSLAGCCGVKSTCGGLAVTSDYIAPAACAEQQRNRRARRPPPSAARERSSGRPSVARLSR